MLVSKYLARGSLTALMTDKADFSLDMHPILGSLATFGWEIPLYGGKD